MSYNEYLRRKREDESFLAWKALGGVAIIVAAIVGAEIVRAWLGTL